VFYIVSALIPYALWRLWTLGPIDRNYKPRRRHPIQYSLGDCLLMTVTFGGIGLIVRSIYDQSPLAFIAALLVLEITGAMLFARVCDAIDSFANAPAETAPPKSS
jgi:hypothetical protein